MKINVVIYCCTNFLAQPHSRPLFESLCFISELNAFWLGLVSDIGGFLIKTGRDHNWFICLHNYCKRIEQVAFESHQGQKPTSCFCSAKRLDVWGRHLDLPPNREASGTIISLWNDSAEDWTLTFQSQGGLWPQVRWAIYCDVDVKNLPSWNAADNVICSLFVFCHWWQLPPFPTPLYSSGSRFMETTWGKVVWLFRNRDVRQFVVIKFGSLNHREFRFKTTFKRKRSAECSFSKAVLTEMAGQT